MIGRVYRRPWSGTSCRLDGVIGAAGFASGDRVVVGHWSTSPVGPLSDVMWASPAGERTLFAPSDLGAEFITSVYDFDSVVVEPALSVVGDGRSLVVDLPDRSVLLEAGPGWNIPPRRRPAWLTRWVERPIARALMGVGVETYGVSPTGVEEWYQATAWRPVVRARASVAGPDGVRRDLGGLASFSPPAGFGFSEPPTTPSLTQVRPLLTFP